MTSIVDIIDAARGLMPIGKRGANGELYEALVLALRAAEMCIANIDHDIELIVEMAELINPRFVAIQDEETTAHSVVRFYCVSRRALAH